MFQPIDPVEQRKQALIQHLVGKAGMAGGGRPVGAMMGRPFGSFVRSGVDPLLRMLAQNKGENFQGINPGQAAAAAALANAPGLQGGGPPGLGGGMPPGQQLPSMSPGEFYNPHPAGVADPYLQSALAMYGGANGMRWG